MRSQGMHGSYPGWPTAHSEQELGKEEKESSVRSSVSSLLILGPAHPWESMGWLWEAEAVDLQPRPEVCGPFGPPPWVHLSLAPSSCEGCARHLAINGVTWVYLLLSCILEQVTFGLTWFPHISWWKDKGRRCQGRRDSGTLARGSGDKEMWLGSGCHVV